MKNSSSQLHKPHFNRTYPSSQKVLLHRTTIENAKKINTEFLKLEKVAQNDLHFTK